MTPTEKAVEAMAKVICARRAKMQTGPFILDTEQQLEFVEKFWRDAVGKASASLTALISLHPGIASLIDGTGVVVPVAHAQEWDKALKAAEEDAQLWPARLFIKQWTNIELRSVSEVTRMLSELSQMMDVAHKRGTADRRTMLAAAEKQP